MDLFTCEHCEFGTRDNFAGIVRELAQDHNQKGESWWAPSRPWALIQADMVMALWDRRRGKGGRREGLCDKHAALLAAMAIQVMQSMCYEAAGVAPGSLTTKDRDLSTGQGHFDQLGTDAHLTAVTKHVRQAVRGTQVGAVLEIDARRLRVRCILTAVDADGLWTAVIPLHQIKSGGDVTRVVRAGG